MSVFLFCPFPATKLREDCLKKGCLETEGVVDYGKKSIIRNPNLSKEELYGLFRTFRYYVNLPESAWPLIKRAEKSDDFGNEIFKLLEEGEGN